MKKTLLLAIMCVFALLGNVKAQQTVEIGADKNLDSYTYAIPTYDFGAYSVSQQIYTEADFDGNLGTIKSISFKLAAAAPSVVTRKYEIYMKHTDRESIVGSFDAFATEDMVFDGEVEIPNTKDAWLTIPFNKKNFDYSGGNVTFLVYDKTGYGESSNYHCFYTYATDQRMAVANNSIAPFNPLDKSTMATNKNQLLWKLNLVRFEMESKAIVKAEPAALDLGETMLGEYWSESKPASLSIKAVATTVTDIKTDNEFIVLPAKEEIDFTADPIVIEVSYNKNAEVDGEVKGNIVISYEDTTLLVPVTANAYTPAEADVWEKAKEITIGTKYADTIELTNLHDNYLLPRETENGKTPDAVYAFELEKESILRAKVEGANAKMSIYREGFEGKGGPSNDNNYKGNILITSEFFFDFNEEVLTGWTVKNNNNNENNWEITKLYGVDSTNCIVSSSYKFDAASGNTFLKADNYLVSEKTYYITENSKLSFDIKTQNTEAADLVKIEVSKDGERMTFIEEVAPAVGAYENKVVDLGAKFAELGLEYSDYHIVLHHQADNKLNVLVDNIRLSNASDAKTRAASNVDEIYGVEYPAGKYYLVAAAQDKIAFEIAIINAEELPATPTNVVATTIDEFSIELEWDAVEKATSYNIYRNEEFVANVKDTTYLDENLDSDVEYCYVVKSFNDIMESVASEKACAKTKKVVLTPPTEIDAKAISTTTIVLTWSKVEKVGGYAIYSGNDYIDRVSDTTYTIENLVPSTEYCYSVSTVYKDRESFEKSDIACTRTLDIIPDVPANVKVEATSESSVKVSWDEAENAKRYYIYSADTLVAKTTYTFYNITNLAPETEYCFTVKSANIEGDVQSEASEQACAKTLKAEPEPEVPGVGIEENSASFNVYPNPVNDKLYIETETEIEVVVIYDVYGRQQDYKTTRQQGNVVVDVKDLNSGVYFVKVVTANGEAVQRFLKH